MLAKRNVKRVVRIDEKKARLGINNAYKDTCATR